jgi:hypothetical protein
MTRGASAIFRSRFTCRSMIGGKELRSLELFRELATVTGASAGDSGKNRPSGERVPAFGGIDAEKATHRSSAKVACARYSR